jgi:hypothetical protein
LVIGITKFPSPAADLIDMITLMLLLAIQVANPGEMACTGSVQRMKVAENVYVAGVEDEGTMTLAAAGQILYLNGPGVPSLKVGEVQRVVRPEGRIHDPLTPLAVRGVYYKDMGTIRIEAINQDSATARVLMSCQSGMLKGDVVIANTPRPPVEFNGALSTRLTPVPRGLVSKIILGKDDARELAAGQFCFIPVGKADGVKAGDQFIVFRPNPKFHSADMAAKGTAAGATYSPMPSGIFGDKMESLLGDRTLPPKVIGDIVIVDAGEKMSTGKIVNSMIEIHLGDLVVKK